jgi:hypothetical protein
MYLKRDESGVILCQLWPVGVDIRGRERKRAANMVDIGRSNVGLMR